MFHEPTKPELQAAAGWTLMKRTSTTPEHVVALDHYRDGCEALLPFAPAAVDCAVSATPTPHPQPQAAAVIQSVPVELAKLTGVVSCADGGNHKWNITTQKCVFCDRTYRDVLKRKPELMV